MSSHGAARQIFHFQLITTPTADTPGTSLLLHFDDQRYLFGQISEGTQRACVQRAVGLAKLRTLFLTGNTNWAATGGLLGMILTVSDVQGQAHLDGTKRLPLSIHGGPKLMHTFASARRFVFRSGMPLSLHESFPDAGEQVDEPTWSDANIKVWTIPVMKASSNSSGFSKISSARNDASKAQDTFENQRKAGSSGEMTEDMATIEDQQECRKSIVSAMFDSDWRRDRLVEAKFSDVNFPALVWYRDSLTKDLVSTRCASTLDIPHLSPDSTVMVRNPWPASLIGSLPSASNLPSEVAISYIVRGYPQRGRFDPKKAKALGIAPGPNFGRLTEGESVTLENGTVITPDMVLGPQEPGQGIAIIDIPDPAYVDDLISRPEWRNERVMKGVKAVVWILGRYVLSDLRLQSFMKEMSTVQHIISSPDTCPNYLALESSAASAIRLSRVWRDTFPVPVHDNITIPQVDEKSFIRSFPEKIDVRYVQAQRGLKIQIAPKFGLQMDEVAPFLDTDRAYQQVPRVVGSMAQDICAKLDMSKDLQSELREPEIITLGTGSAVPSKYRNVSATLLRIPGHGNYLFDCGENTLGQLRRVFEPAELHKVLLDLRMIWISHLHADHHLGTISVLDAHDSARRMDPEKSFSPVYVVGEQNMIGFLADYSSVQNFPLVRHVISDPVHQHRLLKPDGTAFNLADSGLAISKLATCYVSHCYGAQAVSVTFNTGFKFSYSGDCRPSKKFTQIGRNSDVLVHEATFDDGLEGDAMAKKHSTTGEALVVGKLMRAKNLILTHFSQRYQKIPVMNKGRLPHHVLFEEGGSNLSDEAAGPVMEETPTVETALPQGAGPDQTPVQMPVKHLSDQPASGNVNWSPKIRPAWQSNDAAGENEQEMHIAVAFDYMRIRVSDIKNMKIFTRALEKLFAVEIRQSARTENEDSGSDTRASDNSPGKHGDRRTPSGNKPSSPSRSTSSSSLPLCRQDRSVAGTEAKPISNRQLKKQMAKERHEETMLATKKARDEGMAGGGDERTRGEGGGGAAERPKAEKRARLSFDGAIASKTVTKVHVNKNVVNGPGEVAAASASASGAFIPPTSPSTNNFSPFFFGQTNAPGS